MLTKGYDILHAVIEGTSDAIFVKDLEGRYLLVNSACASFIGRPAEEIIGKSDRDLYPPDSARQFVADDRQTIETGATQIFEGTATGPGGLQAYRVTKGVYRDERGKVVGIFGISHDITEHLRVEEERVERARQQAARAAAEAAGKAKDELLQALKLSEERYRSLLENANDIIYSHDLQGKYLTINRAGERITGYTREQVLGGMNISEVVVPEHLEHARQMTQRKLQDPSPTVYEVDINTKDGRRLTLEVSTRIAYRNGLPAEVEGIARDVTERKRAEEERLKSEQRLALAQEAGKIGTFDWDIGTDRVHWTEKLESLFGLPRGGFGGTFDNWRRLLHPEDLSRCDAEIRQALDGKSEEWNSEYRIFRADTGETRWIDARTHIFYDERGKPLRMVGINVDVTERKRAEEERERLLEREQKAREEAERANRLKDEFLATVSHELRTPLTSIIGWVHMIRGGLLDAETATRALETVERSAKAQSQLINDLLDVSRIVTGKLHLEVRPTVLAAVVDASVASVQLAAEAKGIGIRTHYDPELMLLLVDPDRLQQVLWNLLYNAIKFTPQGGRVEVRTACTGSHVEIEVSDTGQGLDANFLPHVFERFRQADQSTTRAHGGLGLGLAIVRYLVELHGGTVRATSGGVGQGATFKVSLPMSIAVAAHKAGEKLHTAQAEDARAETVPQLTGLRVLVVDDDDDVCQLMALLLRKQGAQVSVATSSRGALAALERERFDVLISDIGMPGEDGYALIRKVRALPAEKGGRIPAAALTAYARDEDRVEALLAGFQIHVPKPVNPAEVNAVVASLAGKR